MSENVGPPPRVSSSALIALAIVAGAAIIAWGSGDNAPRYQLVASGDAVVRMDTDSGAMIACNLQRCAAIQPPDRALTAKALRGMATGDNVAVEDRRGR